MIRTPARRAFTLVEVLVSVAILGTSLVTVLGVLGNAARGASEADERGLLELHAGSLASEILQGRPLPRAPEAVEGLPGYEAAFVAKEERIRLRKEDEAGVALERVTIRLFREDDSAPGIEVEVLRRPPPRPEGEARP